jgi:hypothetical protein
VLALLLALVATVGCGGDDPTAALDAAAAGRRELAGIRIEYREERPMRGAVGIVVSGDGTVVVSTERLRAGCDDPRSRTCWETVERRTHVDALAHRALVATLARARLDRVPRDDEPAPSIDRVAITIEVDDAPPVRTTIRVDRAERLPDVAAARRALSALADDPARR